MRGFKRISWVYLVINSVASVVVGWLDGGSIHPDEKMKGQNMPRKPNPNEKINGKTRKQWAQFYIERFQKECAEPQGDVFLEAMRAAIIRHDGRIDTQ